MKNIPEKPDKIPYQRLISVGLLSWLLMIGIDFFFHAGLLADLYVTPTPFLLNSEDAFRSIPLGYLSLLLQTTLLLWLMSSLGIQTWKAGLVFGGKLGLLLGCSLFLGLLSILNATWQFLLGVMCAQIVEITFVGGVIGTGLRNTRLKQITYWVISAVILLVLLTITMQSLGLALVIK